MHRVRLLFLLGLVLAIGATAIAKDQGTPAKDQGQTQDRDSKKDKNKNKDKDKAKNDEGRRKHWWSLPHRHKKHDNDAAKSAATDSSKTAAAKPVKMDKTAARANSGNKSAAVKPGQKAVAKNGQDNKAAAGAHPGKKTMAATGHGKKVRHNCSPEEAKKGGCQEKAHSQKATTSPS